MSKTTFASEFTSLRARHTLSENRFGFESYLLKCIDNLYHPESNPNGIANLGRTEDRSMESAIEDRMRSSDVFEFTSSDHQHYYDLHGKQTLRMAAANFFNTFFNVASNISPDNLVVMSGAAPCLDSLSFALFDPGDIYITPTPTYPGVFTRLNNRSLATPCPLELSEEPDKNGERYTLTPKMLEDKILELQGEGKYVKGFVLINPQNPLGKVYKPSLVRSLLEVCARYKVHAIFDEVYALTLLNTEAEVCSVLSIPNLPDPQRTHFVWALSKDMGLAGLRVAFIHTVNPDVLETLKRVAIYSCSPSIVQDAATSLLSDTKWLENEYFPRRRQTLIERYNTVKNKLDEMDVFALPAEGGLFLWLDLRKFLRSNTMESEFEIFEAIFEAGLYITPGSVMQSTPGWFRMIFSSTQHHLERGISVLESFLKARKSTLQKELSEDKK